MRKLEQNYLIISILLIAGYMAYEFMSGPTGTPGYLTIDNDLTAVQLNESRGERHAVNKKENIKGDKPVACTMDAKRCPDGSFVGRVPPDCRFKRCPGEDKKGDK